MIFFAYHQNQENAINTYNLPEHTDEILFNAEALKAQVDEIQSGIRGFIISGQENYLLLFSNAASTFDTIIRSLKTMTKDNAD